jgi:hypothetical protein
MSKKDIIRMAQEAGVTAERVRDLVNFASLVASAEREVRPWVGLTEEEVFAVSNTMPYGDRFDFAKAIEAKLKEKNT